MGLGARALELGVGTSVQPMAPVDCSHAATAGLSTARGSDWELLNAWLATDQPLPDWQALANAVSLRSGLALVGRGREIGLPLAFIGSSSQ